MFSSQKKIYVLVSVLVIMAGFFGIFGAEKVSAQNVGDDSGPGGLSNPANLQAGPLNTVSPENPVYPTAGYSNPIGDFTPKLQVCIGGNCDIFQSVNCNSPGAPCAIPWLSKYIAIVYQYGVALAAVLATVMIMIGGFLWLTSAGSPNRVGTAKEFIVSAFTGLLLALFSYMILYTVNPQLVTLNPINVQTAPKFDLTGVNESTAVNDSIVPAGMNGGATTGGPGGPASSLTEQQIRADLAAHGVTFWQSRPGATTVEGFSDPMIDFLGNLADQTGGYLLTAGTDHGHPPDTADFGYNQNDSLSQHIIAGVSADPANNIRIVEQYGTTRNAVQYDVPNEGIYTHETNPPHWDFRYGRHFADTSY